MAVSTVQFDLVPTAVVLQLPLLQSKVQSNPTSTRGPSEYRLSCRRCLDLHSTHCTFKSVGIDMRRALRALEASWEAGKRLANPVLGKQHLREECLCDILLWRSSGQNCN